MTAMTSHASHRPLPTASNRPSGATATGAAHSATAAASRPPHRPAVIEFTRPDAMHRATASRGSDHTR